MSITFWMAWFNFNLFWGWDWVLVDGRGRLGVDEHSGVSFIKAEAATEATVVSID